MRQRQIDGTLAKWAQSSEAVGHWAGLHDLALVPEERSRERVQANPAGSDVPFVLRYAIAFHFTRAFDNYKKGIFL